MNVAKPCCLDYHDRELRKEAKDIVEEEHQERKRGSHAE